MIKELHMLKELRKTFALVWWRFQYGAQFLSIINFFLLTITASTTIKNFVNLPYWAIFLLVPTGIVGVILFGYFMQEKVKFYAIQENEMNKRSPTWQEMFTRLDRIESLINKQKERPKF